MNSATFRKVSRVIHFIFGALLGTYIYSPWSDNPVFANIVMWVALPLVVLTGLAMWKQGQVMKWMNRNKNTGARSAN